jgi:hypothetical protein
MLRPLSKEQAVVLMACTGCCLMEPADFHEALEKKFDRAIAKEEYSDPEFMASVQEAFREDMKNLCEFSSGLILPKGV